jgi:hypothetical protein
MGSIGVDSHVAVKIVAVDEGCSDLAPRMTSVAPAAIRIRANQVDLPGTPFMEKLHCCATAE